MAGKKKAELVEEIYVAAARAEGFRDIQGILDITNEGFGYIRAHGYMPSRDDAFVPLNMIRAARLRPGDVIEGTLRPSRANGKFPGLAKIRAINGKDPEEMRHRPNSSRAGADLSQRAAKDGAWSRFHYRSCYRYRFADRQGSARSDRPAAQGGQDDYLEEDLPVDRCE